MRPIKFRAWDNEQKKMFYSETEQFDDSLNFRFGHFDTEEPVYMQCTGLLDINRNKIYEGDLLKHPNGTIAEIRYLNDLAAFVAVYKQNGNTEMDYLHKEIVERCIIVGNRYENKHLLKEVYNESQSIISKTS